MNRKIIWLILVLALVLRFYKLGQIPLSLNWDETSNAYNAYSILKTGRDEYGKFLPLTNRSFDDYKPPLYMYLNVPAVAIFGLNSYAARLPSAVIGTLTVIFFFFLITILVKNKKIALLSAFFLAISPWHLQFSRVGFETNAGLFMAIASFTLFFMAILDKNEKRNVKKNALLILSAACFGLSAYSYHAERIFLPLVFFASVFLYKKEIFSFSKKTMVIFCLLILLIVLPLLIFLPGDALLGRFQSTTQKARIEDVNKSIKFINQDNSTMLAKLIHNRRVVIGQTFFKNYLLHFDLNFLFTTGDDNFRHHVENMGMLYLFQLPLVLTGIYFIIKDKFKGGFFLIFWLMLSPIPAIAGDAVPHAVRSYTMVIPLSVISAYAFIKIYQLIKYKKLMLAAVFVIFTLSIFPYLHNYYTHYQHDYSFWWQYGNREAVDETEKLSSQYQKIKVSGSIDQAYIFWLFNTKYDPVAYQKLGSRDHFDKYYFNQQAPVSSNELYVDTNLPANFQTVKTINYPNGETAIKIGHPQ